MWQQQSTTQRSKLRIMAASNSAINVAASMLAAALLLSCGLRCAQATSAQTCNSPNMCDLNCNALTVVNDCIRFIGDLDAYDFPDLADAAIDGKLTFKRLQAVTGGIRFDSDDNPLVGVRRISFPELLTVGGTFFFFVLDAVEVIEAPFLKQVAGFYIDSMDGLEKLIMPSLQGVDGVFFVQSNGNLKYMAFPLLQVANGELTVDNNRELKKASFPNLKIINDDRGIGIRFFSNPKLKHVRFPSLETIISSGVQVRDNAVLKTVNFPKLKQVGDNKEVTIEENPELKLINIPKLKISALDLNTDDNPKLKNVNQGPASTPAP